MIRFIFGIGTGRCGTGSLAKLLDKQPGIWCSHEGEFCPWEKDLVAYYQSLVSLVSKAGETKIGNVAFYWKNYLSEIFRDLNDPKVIVLKRKKEEVIESFASMYHGKNHWSMVEGENWEGRDPGDAPLTAMWPKYDLSKKEAIGQYWDDYYADIPFWMDKFPQNMMLVDMYDLFNKQEIQKQILEFVGIDSKDMVIDTSIWEHKRKDLKGGLLSLKRAFPKELDQIALNKALYGQAAGYAGLPVDIELQLTEEEMAEARKNPEFEKLMQQANAKN